MLRIGGAHCFGLLKITAFFLWISFISQPSFSQEDDWSVKAPAGSERAGINSGSFDFIKTEAQCQEYFEKIFAKAETKSLIFKKGDPMEKKFSSESELASGATYLLKLAKKKNWTIDLTKENADGLQYLHRAAKFKSTALLDAVLESRKSGYEFDINATDGHGNTALFWSMKSGSLKNFKKLLKEKNIDANIENNSGINPLEWAFTLCNEDYLEPLLKIVKPENFDFTIGGIIAKDWVISNDCVAGLKAIYPKLDPYNLPRAEDGFPIFHEAAIFNAPKIVNYLISIGVDPYLKDGLFIEGVDTPQPETEKPKKKKVSPYGLKAYQHAYMNGATDVYKIYLDKDKSIVNEISPINGNTPLMTAVERGDHSLITLILKHNPMVNVFNRSGKNVKIMLEQWKAVLEKHKDEGPKHAEELKKVEGYLAQVDKLGAKSEDFVLVAMSGKDPAAFKVFVNSLRNKELGSLANQLIAENKPKLFNLMLQLRAKDFTADIKSDVFNNSNTFKPENFTQFLALYKLNPKDFSDTMNETRFNNMINYSSNASFEKMLNLEPPVSLEFESTTNVRRRALNGRWYNKTKTYENTGVDWLDNSINELELSIEQESNQVQLYKYKKQLELFKDKKKLLNKHEYFSRNDIRKIFEESVKDIAGRKPQTELKKHSPEFLLTLSHPDTGMNLLDYAVFYDDVKLIDQLLSQKQKFTSEYLSYQVQFASEKARAVFKKHKLNLPKTGPCSLYFKKIDAVRFKKWEDDTTFKICELDQSAELFNSAVNLAGNGDSTQLDALLLNPTVQKLFAATTSVDHPMIVASQYCDPALFEKLIKAGASVNKANVNHTTPLMICAKNFDATKFLISKGADLYARDAVGEDIIYYCLTISKTSIANECIQNLVSNGFDFNRLNNDNFTRFEEMLTTKSNYYYSGKDLLESISLDLVAGGFNPIVLRDCDATPINGSLAPGRELYNKALIDFKSLEQKKRTVLTCDKALVSAKKDFEKELLQFGFWVNRLKKLAFAAWSARALKMRAFNDRTDPDVIAAFKDSNLPLDDRSPAQYNYSESSSQLCCSVHPYIARCSKIYQCEAEFNNHDIENRICEHFYEKSKDPRYIESLRVKLDYMSFSMGIKTSQKYFSDRAQDPNTFIDVSLVSDAIIDGGGPILSLKLPILRSEFDPETYMDFLRTAKSKTPPNKADVIKAMNRKLDEQARDFYKTMHLTSLKDYVSWKYPQCSDDVVEQVRIPEGDKPRAEPKTLKAKIKK